MRCIEMLFGALLCKLGFAFTYYMRCIEIKDFWDV